MPSQVKVLVVDDSAFMRQVIIKMLEADPEIKVVGYARDGQEALDKVQRFKPDVVTMDVEMPGISGLETLEQLMCQAPTPVVMLSAVTTNGAQATIKALELGAVDFVTKPEKRTEIGQLANELPRKVKMAAGVQVAKVCRLRKPELLLTPPKTPPKFFAASKKQIEVVAVGTSTGGPAALHTLIRSLPPGLPAAMLIVQHMPPGFTATLAQRLNDLGTIPVKEAGDGDLVQKGRALLAPAGWQMEVVREDGQVRVRLSKETPVETLFKPSVDVLFLSVARVYGGKSLGVVMTGMGNDGLRGLKAMKEQGAYGLAEAESSCVVYGMPRAVVEAGLTDKVVPLPQIAGEIINFVSR
ncbi:protein-glutamate methylesterase/protein-glutamine glutaminase [Zhaonella formicivorans]|jgi:two-component system chemotaxis response regulator CheB|uniref:protein-glutamate methylesterase/protein-glutamine glutaminase n=1 Tax=Zhaonella formicivorans TaxID=2528593 RepID=UPI001D0F5F75|nr:chemotaxis response regulator protein-glutamate methylesterase [Zhaonella formicivorans]